MDAFQQNLTWCRGPLIFQTMNSVRSNSNSMKNQRFTPLGCKNIGVRKCNFVAKTQFLCHLNMNLLNMVFLKSCLKIVLIVFKTAEILHFNFVSS